MHRTGDGLCRADRKDGWAMSVLTERDGKATAKFVPALARLFGRYSALRISCAAFSSTDSFLLAGVCLMRYSSLSASLFDMPALAARSLTGPRDRVYLAPVPRLWHSSRFSRSLLIPQYSERSLHWTRYTTQFFSGFDKRRAPLVLCPASGSVQP